jgi:hypothetical protein
MMGTLHDSTSSTQKSHPTGRVPGLVNVYITNYITNWNITMLFMGKFTSRKRPPKRRKTTATAPAMGHMVSQAAPQVDSAGEKFSLEIVGEKSTAIHVDI